MRLALLGALALCGCGASTGGPDAGCPKPVATDQVFVHACKLTADGGPALGLGAVREGACFRDTAGGWLLWQGADAGADFVGSLDEPSLVASGAAKTGAGCSWSPAHLSAKVSTQKQPSVRVTFTDPEGTELQHWRCDAADGGGVTCIPVL